MKRVTQILLTSLIILGSLNLSSAQVERSHIDIKKRIEMFDSEGYQMAVNHLKSKFGNSYRTVRGWEKALTDITEGRDNYIKAIESGDSEIVSRVAELLSILDKNLLSNPMLKDQRIMVTKRYFEKDARGRMSGSLGIPPSNFQNNSEIWNPSKGWDTEFVSFTNFGKSLRSEVLYRPDSGKIILDPEPSFDGNRVMFSSIGTDDRWHLFELDLESKSAKQLTPDSYKDFDSFDGCYTPDGRYIFSSTGTFLGLPCTNGGNKMCGMFLYDPKTDDTRQLTFDQDSDMGAVVLNSGQIMYSRWEYADLPHSNSRIIFTMNPDGTSQQAKYGSNSYFPTSFANPRPIPGHPTAMVGVASGHHGNSHSGRLMVIDSSIGRHEAEGVVAEIPYRGRKVEPLVRDRFADGVWPQFLTPFPLDENFFLVSMKASPTSLWGVYLVDTFNNLTLISEQEDVALLEPTLLAERETPSTIPDRVDLDSKTATIFMQDIYFGGGLKDIPRGAVKSLRVASYNFSPHNQGGLLGTIGMDGPWDIKRILGTVEVEEDGSAMFTVPANMPIFVQPLDEEGKALQVMRSWFTAMPGETLSCIGCHEDKNSVALPKVSMASKSAPKGIKPWKGEARGFAFEDEVQPVLDKYCVSCHDDIDKRDRPYLKGDIWIDDWNSQISGHAAPDYGGHFTESYTQLHGYIRRSGIESDIHMLTPMDFHADQTELMQILNKGHHNVNISDEDMESIVWWIDMNAPFHGRRSDIPKFERSCKSNELREKYASLFKAPVIAHEEGVREREPVVPVRPTPLKLDTVTPVVDGWPFKSSAFNRQINLGLVTKHVRLSDKTTIELLHIPSGSFVMGSGRNSDELPKSEVSIDKDFWIGRFEITNEQYREFKRDHDSRDEHMHGYQFGRRGYDMNRDDQPVVRVSWREAVEYCKWLSEKTGLNFDLPTEAQWEWACRAGSSEAYSFGDIGDNFTEYGNMGDISLMKYAACTAHKYYEGRREILNPTRYDDWVPRDTTYNDGSFISERVGAYRDNFWGLNDMHGNVWEWTKSTYKAYPYIATDGRNSIESNSKRVARGGSWYDRPHKATSSYRLPYRDYQKVFNVGFRVVISEK